jgi:hypothetical protein
VGTGSRLRPGDRAHRLPHDHRPRARDRLGRPRRRAQLGWPPVTESEWIPRLPRPIGDARPVTLGWMEARGEEEPDSC